MTPATRCGIETSPEEVPASPEAPWKTLKTEDGARMFARRFPVCVLVIRMISIGKCEWGDWDIVQAQAS